MQEFSSWLYTVIGAEKKNRTGHCFTGEWSDAAMIGEIQERQAEELAAEWGFSRPAD
jgi:hypothetical protein